MSNAATQDLLPPPHLRGHVPVLDGIRGLAMFMVFLVHVVDRTQAPHLSFDWWALQAIRGLWTSIDLFFVLSGYLITGILRDSRRLPGYFKAFYARRALRIFPLYYVCLTVLYIAVSLTQAREYPFGAPAWWYYLYMQSYLMFSSVPVEPIPAGFSVTWSLAVEEQFYMVWPLLAYLLSHRAMMRFCMVMLAVQVVARGLLYHFVGEEWATIAYAFTPTRLDALVLGSLIALIVRTEGGYERLVQWCKPAMLLGGAGTLVCYFLAGDSGPHNYPTGIYGYTFLALFYGGFLVLALDTRKDTRLYRVLTSRLYGVWGKYSYAIYLLHLPIIYLVVRHLFGFLWTGRNVPTVLGSQLPVLFGMYLIAAPLALGAAWLSWNLLEKRVLTLKSRFTVARPGSE